MDRSSLLDRVQSSHSAFVECVNRSTVGGLRASLANDDPALVDVLNHILIHQERMLTWLEESLVAGGPVDCQPYEMPEAELNALNETIKAEGRGRAADELMASLDRVQRRVLDFVGAAPEAFLFGSERWRLRGGEPLWMAVAANTYEHYDEHLNELR